MRKVADGEIDPSVKPVIALMDNIGQILFGLSNVTTIKATLADGTTASVSGTVIGPKHHQKIVNINGYDVELAVAEHMVQMVYTDRPGIVAA